MLLLVCRQAGARRKSRRRNQDIFSKDKTALLRATAKNAMHHDAMQIVCPNCSTAYEVPDEVFAGRVRRLRCEQCGQQWRAGPPESTGAAWPDMVAGDPELPEAPAPQPACAPAPQPAPETLAAPETMAAPEMPPAADMRPALGSEPPYPDEPAPPASGAWHFERVGYEHREVDDGTNDPFINLVHAARSRQLETEPEPPPPPLLRTSGPVFFGALVVAFVVAFLVMEFRPFGVGF